MQAVVVCHPGVSLPVGGRISTYAALCENFLRRAVFLLLPGKVRKRPKVAGVGHNLNYMQGSSLSSVFCFQYSAPPP